jgi:hypothetical protein
MTQADCVLSTPPTNTPVDTTRRHFLLAVGGGTAAMLAATIPEPATTAPAAAMSAGPLDASKASPALRAAVRALDEANDRLTAAKARFDQADKNMAAWTEDNPEPAGKRAYKRWARRWRERQDAIVGESWDAQLEAERDFRTCQMAVAKVKPRDEEDLMCKAAVAAVYDKVKHASYGDVAVISYSVAWDLIKLPA